MGEDSVEYLLVGGNAHSAYASASYLYDEEADTWTRVADRSLQRRRMACTLMKGGSGEDLVVVAGMG